MVALEIKQQATQLENFVILLPFPSVEELMEKTLPDLEPKLSHQ